MRMKTLSLLASILFNINVDMIALKNKYNRDVYFSEGPERNWTETGESSSQRRPPHALRPLGLAKPLLSGSVER